MPDVCVTCPKDLWEEWLGEGALPGAPCPPGTEYLFRLGPNQPRIAPGERVYVVAHGRLRGYAPLVRLQAGLWGWQLVRHGGAVACTIPEPIKGFRGWRYRWWRRGDELPFPGWREP